MYSQSASAFWPFGIGLLLAVSAHAQEVNVLAANYEFKLTIDEQVHSIQDRSLVRSGHEGEDLDASAFKTLVRQAVAVSSAGKSNPSKKAKP